MYKEFGFEQHDESEKSYTTKARNYKITKSNKKTISILIFSCSRGALAAQARALRERLRCASIIPCFRG